MHNKKCVNLLYTQLYKIALIALLLFIHACAINEETNESNASEVVNTSSLLADNPLISVTDFDNFKNKTISIDPSALPLSGSRLFLKLYQEGGNIVFLGEIDRFSLFSMEVSILLDVNSLNYEIFSNDVSDNTHFGMILL